MLLYEGLNKKSKENLPDNCSPKGYENFLKWYPFWWEIAYTSRHHDLYDKCFIGAQKTQESLEKMRHGGLLSFSSILIFWNALVEAWGCDDVTCMTQSDTSPSEGSEWLISDTLTFMSSSWQQTLFSCDPVDICVRTTQFLCLSDLIVE